MAKVDDACSEDNMEDKEVNLVANLKKILKNEDDTANILDGKTSTTLEDLEFKTRDRNSPITVPCPDWMKSF